MRVPIRHRLLVTLLVGLAAPVAPALAAMRCGNHLITEGDTAGLLQARCGPPTEVSQQTIVRPPVIWRHGRPYQVPGGDIEVRVEIWTYNFGPNQLMRRIRLEDGIVKTIETLGHGYL